MGVKSSPVNEEDAVDWVVARLRERTVIEVGTVGVTVAAGGREDGRGGVLLPPLGGAGSLDRTECTLASSRCIWAVSRRMCDNELDAGIL